MEDPDACTGPLFWRTYRYIQMTVETAGEAVSIDDLRGVYTGYPFSRRARLNTGNVEIDRILDTGWRTARLCAHESYMGLPLLRATPVRAAIPGSRDSSPST